MAVDLPGQVGLQVLHGDGVLDSSITADIAFIHGLMGDPILSWSTKDIFWPKEFLGPALPMARIMTYGYNGDPNMLGRTAGGMDRAQSLIQDLCRQRRTRESSSRPIFFIAHSLGGILLENALLASLHATHPQKRQILECTRGIIFLGTPQAGSNIGNWAHSLGKLLKISGSKQSLIRDLSVDAESLGTIQSKFHKMLRDRGKPSIEMVFFYETLSTPNIGIVVAMESATLPGSRSYPMNTDHGGMTKFASQNDIGYVRMLNKLKSWIFSISTSFPAQGGVSASLPSKIDSSLSHPLPSSKNLDEKAIAEESDEVEKTTAEIIADLLDQGQDEKAEQLQSMLLERRRLAYGDQDLETIQMSGNLAAIWWRQCRWEEAEKLQTIVLEGMRKALGEHHPSTLSAMNNLSSTMVSQGHLQRATELQKEVWDAMSRIEGEESLPTINAMSNFAITLALQGQLNRAIELLQRALDGRQKQLGLEHPDTLVSMINLSDVFFRMSDFEKAKDLQEQARAIALHILGDEHPTSLTVTSDLARTLAATGDVERAIYMQLNVLQARRRVLGPNHQDTLNTAMSLAMSLASYGEFEAAESLQQQVVNDTRKQLGDRNPLSVKAAAVLVIILTMAGKYGEAERYQTLLVAQLTTYLGEDHPDTLGAKAVLRKIVEDRAAAGLERGKGKSKDEMVSKDLLGDVTGAESAGT